MTPEQKTALVAACEQGDDVKIVTIALQVCAWLARNKRQEDAVTLRNQIDDISRLEHSIRKHRETRLQVAMAIMSDGSSHATQALSLADDLILVNNKMVTPFDVEKK